MQEMWSHRVIPRTDLTNEQDCGYEWPRFWANVGKQGGCFEIEELHETLSHDQHPDCYQGSNASHPWNNTPFYVMNVPGILVPNHNAIFQDGAVELLIAIFDHFGVTAAPATMSVAVPK